MTFNIICGEPWTRMERSLIFWFSQRGISGPALRFFHKLLHVAKRAPRGIITDKLRSYAAAKKLIVPDIEHRQSRF